MERDKNKIVIGMSGGVDSSVAAHLLKEEGYDVYGLCLTLWDHSIARDAKAVADRIGIPLKIMDIREIFQADVIKYFASEYMVGRTPNPCIMCNPLVKWKMMLYYADEICAEYIATGHYAEVVRLENGRYTLQLAAGIDKDQTYALYRLTQEQLERTIMPVGCYEKNRIREIASEIGLIVADKKDSQEICFIPDNDYAGYIEAYTGVKSAPGDFVDEEGLVLGQHRGIIHYTVGQRKGLGLSMGRPVYVREIRSGMNQVVVGEDKKEQVVYAGDLNFPGLCEEEIQSQEDEESEASTLACTGKIRYNHRGASCKVTFLGGDRIKVVFDEPQRAVTPGQSLVLYKDGILLGGGFIM